MSPKQHAYQLALHGTKQQLADLDGLPMASYRKLWDEVLYRLFILELSLLQAHGKYSR